MVVVVLVVVVVVIVVMVVVVVLVVVVLMVMAVVVSVVVVVVLVEVLIACGNGTGKYDIVERAAYTFTHKTSRHKRQRLFLKIFRLDTLLGDQLAL